VVVVHPVNRETQSGEIDILAVDPDYQHRGIGLASRSSGTSRRCRSAYPAGQPGITPCE